jgi:hypothetical protein
MVHRFIAVVVIVVYRTDMLEPFDDFSHLLSTSLLKISPPHSESTTLVRQPTSNPKTYQGYHYL